MSTAADGAEFQTRAMVETWARAIRAKDVAGVVACQAEDCVQFELAPPLRVVGSDHEGLQAWFDTWRGPVGVDIAEMRIFVREDLAFCSGLIHLTGDRTDGSTTEIWIRNTLGLRKIGGEWKIVHLHESVPVHMDGTFRGALNLEP